MSFPSLEGGVDASSESGPTAEPWRDSGERPTPLLAVHLGLPRTGTKFLQWNVLAHHPSVDYLGIFAGRLSGRGKRAVFPNPTVAELVGEALGRGLGNTDLSRCRRLRDELLQAADDRRLVLSYEGLSLENPAVRRRRAENLWRIFGRRVRLLMVLRSPAKLIASAYGLEFRNRNNRFDDGAFWLASVDEWFEQEQVTGLSGYLGYADTLRLYTDLFGVDTIRVLLFEDFLADRLQFAEQVCAHFGIPGPGVGIQSLGSANDSPKAWQHAAIRWLSRSSVSTRLYAVLPRRVRFQLNRPHRFGRRAHVELSAENRRRVDELTRPGNRWIRDTFDVELEGKGYSL